MTLSPPERLYTYRYTVTTRLCTYRDTVTTREIIYLSLHCHHKIIYLSLHCHHQNDSCIKMGSNESHFNISLIVGDKVTRQRPQTTKRKRRAEADSNRDPSAYQPNALPLGQTGSRASRSITLLPRRQYCCTENVLWCQVYSSHIHTNHKTLLDYIKFRR